MSIQINRMFLDKGAWPTYVFDLSCRFELVELRLPLGMELIDWSLVNKLGLSRTISIPSRYSGVGAVCWLCQPGS